MDDQVIFLLYRYCNTLYLYVELKAEFLVGYIDSKEIFHFFGSTLFFTNRPNSVHRFHNKLVMLCLSERLYLLFRMYTGPK